MFQTDPLLLFPLIAVGAIYVLGYRRLARLRRHTPGGTFQTRSILFALGYVGLVVALVSPLHAVGEQLFSVHMLQHLLLTLIAPPLLLLSNSMPVLLWGLPAQERAGLGALVGRPGPARTVLRALTRPLGAWWLFVLTQWLWHQPAAYQWALENRWAHYGEHLSFFVSAMLFWWPVIGSAPLPSPLSYPARMLYTFSAWMPNTFLGAGLTLSSGLLYPFYAQQTGVDTYADQQLAGLLMWMPGDVVFAIVLLLLVVAFLQHEQRTAERIERELDRGAAFEVRGARGRGELRPPPSTQDPEPTTRERAPLT